MSTQRKIVFANDSYYHIYNRGYDRREIFGSSKEYKRAIMALRYYRFTNLPVALSRYLELTGENQSKIIDKILNVKNQRVEIIAYCLMPNHFHFLLKQTQDEGIKKFVADFSNSYTKYYNTRHQRSSSLLQGTFQAVYIESNEQLLHLSRYIHLNPIVSSRVEEKDLNVYPWSSYREYLGLNQGSICNPSIILDQFRSPEKYGEFVSSHLERAIELEEIKHLVFE